MKSIYRKDVYVQTAFGNTHLIETGNIDGEIYYHTLGRKLSAQNKYLYQLTPNFLL